LLINFIHLSKAIYTIHIYNYHCSAAWLSAAALVFKVEVVLTPVVLTPVFLVGVERDDAVLGLEVTTRGLTYLI